MNPDPGVWRGKLHIGRVLSSGITILPNGTTRDIRPR